MSQPNNAEVEVEGVEEEEEEGVMAIDDADKIVLLH